MIVAEKRKRGRIFMSDLLNWGRKTHSLQDVWEAEEKKKKRGRGRKEKKEKRKTKRLLLFHLELGGRRQICHPSGEEGEHKKRPKRKKTKRRPTSSPPKSPWSPLARGREKK